MTQLNLSPQARQALHAVVFAEEREARVEALLRFGTEAGARALLEMVADLVTLADQVIDNGREHAVDLLIQETDMHPYSAEKLNYPSLKGALVGLEAAERVPAHARDRVCPGCAYRPGSVANQCFTTQTDADCVLESGDAFLCHARGLDDVTDEPTRPCIGHAYAARQHAKDCMEDHHGPEGAA
ncbi:hypothetical protein [Halomonas salipaludis]|uniref:Uncharacterized protein n=1 Tax=Halomonas salipaludis TaxID=2032625 RepID=A0A2A2F3B8_9GAMM|nr:hypothetical protein [Halomonas salipaludis]PAU79204.1 hypothetical protein CK498_02215 [Halomonas salipaludis]